RGTFFLERSYEHPALGEKPVVPRDTAVNRNRLTTDAEKSPPRFFAANEIWKYEEHSRKRNSETDSLRGHDHRGVHADDFALRVYKRTAGVSGIQRRIGLNNIFEKTA